jgi:hypothetical protein
MLCCAELEAPHTLAQHCMITNQCLSYLSALFLQSLQVAASRGCRACYDRWALAETTDAVEQSPPEVWSDAAAAAVQALVTRTDAQGWTLLHRAVLAPPDQPSPADPQQQQQQPQEVEGLPAVPYPVLHLLQLNADPLCVGPEGITPLELAIRQHRFDTIAQCTQGAGFTAGLQQLPSEVRDRLLRQLVDACLDTTVKYSNSSSVSTTAVVSSAAAAAGLQQPRQPTADEVTTRMHYVLVNVAAALITGGADARTVARHTIGSLCEATCTHTYPNNWGVQFFVHLLCGVGGAPPPHLLLFINSEPAQVQQVQLPHSARMQAYTQCLFFLQRSMMMPLLLRA